MKIAFLVALLALAGCMPAGAGIGFQQGVFSPVNYPAYQYRPLQMCMPINRGAAGPVTVCN